MNQHQLRIENITEDNLQVLENKLMELEPYWEISGETLWNEENLRMQLPGKFSGLSKVAFLGDDVVGYLIASKTDDSTAKINKIVTHGDVQRKSVATSLWNSLIGTCKQEEIERLAFRALTDNTPALSFYVKKGCVFDGYTRGTDNKMRRDIFYSISLKDRVAHSHPTISASDAGHVVNQIMSGNLSHGSASSVFAKRVGEYIGKSRGIFTSSGSNALFLAVKALQSQDRNEVIVPSYVCGSVMHAVQNASAIPIIADIDKDGYSISAQEVWKHLSPRTAAIVVPHMFGSPAKGLEQIMSVGIPVIEDCAQAIGAQYPAGKVGSLGNISIFSFYATKMLTTGSGGMVLTDNESLYEDMLSMTQNDRRKSWGEAYSILGDDIHASIGISQLSKLDAFVQRRKEIASMYSAYLGGAADIVLPDIEDGDAHFRYVIRSPLADKILASLNRRGVDAQKPVYLPLHRYIDLPNDLFPNSEKAFAHSVSLPIYPSIPDERVRDIAGMVLNWRYEQ